MSFVFWWQLALPRSNGGRFDGIPSDYSSFPIDVDFSSIEPEGVNTALRGFRSSSAESKT